MAMWSAKEKHACAQRELVLRIRVYARQVAQGKMSKESAGREIALMSAIAEDYRKLAEAEQPLPLFASC
jgi:hypothetical protein